MAGGVLTHVSPIEKEAEELAMEIEKSQLEQVPNSDDDQHITGSTPASRRQSLRSLDRSRETNKGLDGAVDSAIASFPDRSSATRPALKRDRVSWLFRGMMKDDGEQ